MNTYLDAVNNSLDAVNTYLTNFKMESELRRCYLVKVSDGLEKLETLLAKRNNTINLQDMEMNSIKKEIELLTERINKAKEYFDDKNKRRIWLRLIRQKVSAKTKLKKLITKRTCENEEKTTWEIKRSELISEKNRIIELVRQDSNS